MGLHIASSPATRGMALVVDDESTNRLVLAAMLKREGFHVVEARNGSEALTRFEASRPDIIFMDVMMPGMDGLEATQHLKTLSGNDFVPIIFLTALHDDQSLVRCIEAGGDDFLSKPFSFNVLKSRIVAMERVRDLHRHIAAKNRMLARLLEIDRQEQVLAERIFSHAVNDRNVAGENLGILMRPAATFNGDLLLSQYLPDGSLRVLLGDFTGHGLSAAIGALPVADAFHSMTRKGVADEVVLEEINRKLHRVLPTDRFMCAFMVTFPVSGGDLRWWNGGMPDGLVCHAEGIHRLASHALPLGILPELSHSDAPRRRPLRMGDRLLLITDGLLEAQDAEGRAFGQAGWPELIANWTCDRSLLAPLLQSLDAHCADTDQQDDIGAVEIPVTVDIFGCANLGAVPSSQGGVACSVLLRDGRLARTPSMAHLLGPLGLQEELGAHLGALETVLHELYTNALEHGILRLPSWMKATPDGFSAYYVERESRLAAGPVGSIRVDIAYESGPPGTIRITITDSGQGFDFGKPPEPLSVSVKPWGRGIALVRELCESVNYCNLGTQVEAVYRCV
ncbi:ATP-binding SpoIIE family protein phosphatase [Ectothiorhodospira lacustris]|uniref:ATP-binding SpoIIE family protein phosphatase n=1 Tax=Ectothiorhodospira lacustris TaxID=2899127 RepID=UPI001EE79F0D|nr:fused response regulator/phosphatase [Ectothiorhodospira lacustris]MCG5510121.1 fused response regulator/phosphatase [Ectothiorhodospira lacustris]MCG5521964.1 fused response regulator/phosphatase [Ectothiorhodospira lacustris]